jgi:ketosteroid isomerase-like protein
MKTLCTHLKARILLSIFLCGMILLWGVSVFGQEWTAEQKEIWQAVETNWKAIENGDVEAALKLKHDRVFIWNRPHPEPITKDMLKVTYKDWFKMDKPTSTKIRPLKINIFNNIANVYYLYKYEGVKIFDKGRILETWIKQNNKWLLIGGLSSSCDTPPNCPHVW